MWNQVTICEPFEKPWAKMHVLSFTFASFKYFGHKHTKVTDTYGHKRRKKEKGVYQDT